MIETLERAVGTLEMFKDSETVPPGAENALPAMSDGDGNILLWCDLTAKNGSVPIQVFHVEDPRDRMGTFDSIADLVKQMAALLDERLWISTPEYSWHYVGKGALFDWR